MRAKEELPECPVATAVSLIGGKWKLLILRNLKERPWRFNELQRSIDGISQKVLTDSLRQMMICHMWAGAGKIKFGIYACSPEDSSFKAVFTDMKLTECQWKAHDGQKPDEM